MDEKTERLAERVAELERQVAALRASLGIEPESKASGAPVNSPKNCEPPPLSGRSSPVSLSPSAMAPSSAATPAPTAIPARPTRIWRTEADGSNRDGSNRGENPVLGHPPPVRLEGELQAKLRAWKLWPPEGEESLEVQVGAWWATRIGALLAVIGVVFFGLYLVHGVPPSIRWLQLLAVALGVTAAGHWLERRDAKFGAVVFGSGMALVFFAGFAAYAVPAVKIIHEPLLAVAIQGVVVAVVAATSFWKDRSNLATMAVLCGFVTCFFSFAEQLQDICLVAAFFLATASAGLWLAKRWLPPLALSVPAAYVIYGTIVLFGWGEQAPTVFAQALAFPVGMFILFTATDYAGLRRGRTLAARKRRCLQGCNAAGAAGLGLLATGRYFAESIAWFYLLFAGLFLVGSLLYWRRNREDEMAQAWFAAGMGFLALGWIEILGARTRSVALAIQATVILQVARKTRLWTAEVAMGLIWIGSAALFLHDAAAAGYFREPREIWSLWGLAAAGYLAISGMLLSSQGRWFSGCPVHFGARETSEPERAVGESNKSVLEAAQARFQLNLLYGVLLGGVATAAAVAGFNAAYLPAGAMLVAVLLVGCAAVARHWVALAGAVFPFVFAQWSLWSFAEGQHPELTLWVNGAVCIGIALMAVSAVYVGFGRQALPESWKPVLAGVAHGFWLISVQMLLLRVTTLEVNLLAAGGLGLLLLGLAGWRRIDCLADLAVAPAGLALVTIAWVRWRDLEYVAADGGLSVLWAAVAAVFVVVCGRECWKRCGGLVPLFPSRRVSEWSGAVVATILGLYLVGREFDYPFLIGTFGVAGVLMLILGRWPGWSAAVPSAVVFLVFGYGSFLISIGLERGDELAWTVVLAVATLACAVGVGDRRLVRRIGVVTGLQWFLAALAAGSLFLLFLTRTGGLAPYVTVFWGISAISLFVTGLIGRARPLRVVGLIALGICLPRIFLVDIHSTFYRIAAFVVIGLVLLVVGFLYHRFRNLIGGVAESPPE